MSSITIFDPAMCCSTGVCGPSVDPELTRVASALFVLEQKGVTVNRYNLANDPAEFVQHEEVKSLIELKGVETLPLVFIDQNLFTNGHYPTNEKLAELFSLDIKDFEAKKPKIKVDFKTL